VSHERGERGRALDCYADGLGTQRLGTLVGRFDRVGDSLLLRAIRDVDGWQTEHYERLDVGR